MRKFWPLFALLFAAWAYLLLQVPFAQSHEWFSGKRNPVTGYGCCSGTDCHLIETEDWWEEGGLIHVRWAGKEWTMPADQAEPSQDKGGRAAACIWNGQLRCFFTPLNF